MRQDSLARIQREYVEVARENQARVLAGTGSPKILVGGINVAECPNFHTIPLIEMGASIVSVTDRQEHALRPDRMWVPLDRAFMSYWDQLPSKWKPDFFWNPQVEHGHWLPIGLGEIPIPTIASFVHAHLGQVLIHLKGMFDCLVAPDPFMAHHGNAVLPWGASWGTLGKRIAAVVGDDPGTEKDLDIVCTLSPSGLGKESVRASVIEAIRALALERKDLKIVVVHGLTMPNYYDLLRRAKVVVNVGNWGNPMTYRPLEALDCLAALVHVDETSYGSTASMEEYNSGGWCVVARPETVAEVALEELAAYSLHEAKMDRGWLESMYSYDMQYERLFERAAKVTRTKRFSFIDWSRHAFAVNQLAGFPEIAQAHAGALTPEDQQSVAIVPENDWDVCLWQPEDAEQRTRWMTDLARGEEPREVYRRYL